MRIKTYQTVSMATKELQKKGFDADFVLEKGKMRCAQTHKTYVAKNMEILEFHWFKGDSDSNVNSIIYAVKCNDGQQGTVVSAYGMYGSAQINDFMKQVKVAEKNQFFGPIYQQTGLMTSRLSSIQSGYEDVKLSF